MKAIWAISFFVLTIWACSSTRITSTWKAVDQTPQHFNKILILGMISDKDRSLQEKMETHLVNDLREKGYVAIGALERFGPKYFDELSEDQALKKIEDQGIDGVITVVLLDKKKEKHYVAGNIYYSPYAPYYDHFWRYRSSLYFRIYEPGYYVTNTEYFWESNVYELKTQKILYSIQTKAFDPANAEKLSHEYGQKIIQKIFDNKIIQ